VKDEAILTDHPQQLVMDVVDLLDLLAVLRSISHYQEVEVLDLLRERTRRHGQKGSRRA